MSTNEGKRIYEVIYKVVVETNSFKTAFHFGIFKVIFGPFEINSEFSVQSGNNIIQMATGARELMTRKLHHLSRVYRDGRLIR